MRINKDPDLVLLKNVLTCSDLTKGRNSELKLGWWAVVGVDFK